MNSTRIIGISIWVFVNLTMLGLLVYVYLLWSVYWKTAGNSRGATTVLETSVQKVAPGFSPWQGKLQGAADGRPRYYWNDTFMLSRLAVPTDKLQSKIETYKSQLVVKLRQSQLDALNVLRGKEINSYNVQYLGDRSVPPPPSLRRARSLLCRLRSSVRLRFLDGDTEPFRSLGLGGRFPLDAGDAAYWSAVHYNSCAVVSSAGSLHKSSLGKEIDAHDAVLRFNSAPTEAHECDVGSKTTFRILNSQVVSKPEFRFLVSPLYQNLTLFAWDPSNYTVDIEEWYKHPDFDIFTPYFKHRQLYPMARFYVLHPQMIWDTWSYLQYFTSVPVMRHPPSSGFLGIVMMAHLCNSVDVYEYIPSMRMTKRCHYFDFNENLACTFGAWHPLASEKLLAMAMNSGTDADIFDVGKIHIKGIASFDCSDS